MADSKAILAHYDEPMWQSFSEERLKLQKCGHCGVIRYPPAPVCASCLSLDYTWSEVKGGGEILSWVVFHRSYFDDHPHPYNAIAVRLDEGPIVVSNLIGPEPPASWIGARVTIAFRRHLDRMQHAFMLAPRP